MRYTWADQEAQWKEALRLFPTYAEIRKSLRPFMTPASVAKRMGCDDTMPVYIIVNYSALKEMYYQKEFDKEKSRILCIVFAWERHRNQSRLTTNQGIITERSRLRNVKRKQKDPEVDIDKSTSSKQRKT